MVMGAIVPVVNFPGIKAGELVIDGPTLAKIYLGEITKWDDPAIKKLNPSVKLPSQAIAVVHRSDGSGTTFNFDLLSVARSARTGNQRSACNTSVEWPVGIGAKGNEGVSNNASQTKGSIGYVEYAYALQNKMTYTKMINQGRQDRFADQRSVPSRRRERRLELGAGLRCDPCGSAGRRLLADDGCDLYPDPEKAAGSGRRRPRRLSSLPGPMPRAAKMAEDLVYVPMPQKVATRSKRCGPNEIKDASGKPLHVTSK